jgi:predicted nucleic acid-binding protein
MAIVDASVVVEFVAPDSNTADAAHRVFVHWAETGETLHAPAMLGLEMMSALLTGVRRGRWDGQAADTAARFGATLPITSHDDDRDRARAWELSRRHDNYPIYDMLYVAVAERLGEPLVTLDAKLRSRLAHLGWVLDPGQALAALATDPAAYDGLVPTEPGPA